MGQALNRIGVATHYATRILVEAGFLPILLYGYTTWGTPPLVGIPDAT